MADSGGMKADFVRCSCTRMNDPWRRFCGGCGKKLEPGCGCGFVNAKSDHYCGGCGVSLLPAPPRRTNASDDSTTIPIEILEVVQRA